MEDEGLATVLIALVHRQAEEVRPPRALWVPFPLGRPFGAAGNASFQRRVLKALLALFDEPAGPVLEVFPSEAPPDGGDRDILDHIAVKRHGPLLEEVDGLGPFHEASLRRRGRTTMGGSGFDAQGAARLLAEWLDGGACAMDMAGINRLRLAAEDLKTYYMEAATADGAARDGQAVTAWFWTRTAAGRTIDSVRRKCLESDSPTVRDAASYMFVPESVEG